MRQSVWEPWKNSTLSRSSGFDSVSATELTEGTCMVTSWLSPSRIYSTASTLSRSNVQQADEPPGDCTVGLWDRS